MRKIGYMFALCCLAFAGFACNNQDRTPAATIAPVAKVSCDPGIFYGCNGNCANGAQAWKLCNDNGASYGVCACPVSAPATVQDAGNPDAPAPAPTPDALASAPAPAPSSASDAAAPAPSLVDITVTVVLPPAPVQPDAGAALPPPDAPPSKRGCQQGNGTLSDGSTRLCGYVLGACHPGTQTCNDGAWSDCLGGTTPQPEVCNGIDDDCNNKTDDGIVCQCDPLKDQYRDCGSNIGMCKFGRQYCVASGNDYVWSTECLNGITPRGERCDNLDWDCNDVPHNGFNLMTDVSNCGACGNVCARPGTIASCVSGVCQYTCMVGYYNLDKSMVNGCEYLCPYTKPLAAELCNGLDDNCNGQIDEGCNFDVDPANCGKPGRQCQFANAVAACVDGDCRLGACADGYIDLDKNPWNGCELSCTKTSDTEVCGNKKDDNCDGQVDEGCPCNPNDTSTVQCLANGNLHSNTGICKATTICQANGQLAACQVIQAPLSRQCNDDGLDRDCDGISDIKQYDLGTDVFNCGKCGNVCSFPNAAALCTKGVCSIGTCAPGFNDVDKDPKNGCEYPCFPTNGGVEQCDGIDNDCNGKIDDGPAVCTCTLINSPRDCGPPLVGECRPGVQTCKAPGEWKTCDLTKAVMPTVEVCNGKDDDCDGVADNGFDLATDPNNCGACNVKCSVANGTAGCVAGKCVIASCNKYYQNLDNDPGNGCEFFCVPEGPEVCDGRDNDCNGKIDDGIGPCGCIVGSTQTCGKNVGACHAGNQTCVGPAPGSWGSCNGAITGTPEICNGIDDDCNGTADDNFNLQTDVNNCGSCGHVCQFANATAACVAGVCQMVACDQNWHDFNHSTVDGCEVPCVVTNGGVEQCDGIDNNCNGQADEGFDLNSNLLNCGACGHACNLPNAVPVCTAGVCQIASCAPGHVDLNKDPSDGCEHACTPTNNGVEICDGLDNDCNGTPDDGIFCNCTSAQSPRECGTGVGMCQTGLQTCVSGVWQACANEVDPRPIICDANTDLNCNGIPDSLEWSTSNDTSNCGGCGIVCSFPHAAVSCVAGVCTMGACAPGFNDIDKDPKNGCEYPCFPTNGGVEQCDGIDNDCNGKIDDATVTVLSDPFNCGACGNVCALPNVAVNGCTAGVCGVVHCLPGYADTNGVAADGCETVILPPDGGVGGSSGSAGSSGADGGGGSSGSAGGSSGSGGSSGGGGGTGGTIADGGVSPDAGGVLPVSIGTIACVWTGTGMMSVTVNGIVSLGLVAALPAGSIGSLALGMDWGTCWPANGNSIGCYPQTVDPSTVDTVAHTWTGVPLTRLTPRVTSSEWFDLRDWTIVGCAREGCGGSRPGEIWINAPGCIMNATALAP